MKRRKRYYGAWAGRPEGAPENPERCIVEVSEPGRWIHFYQCQRKRGHGPDGEFCKQHGRMIENGNRLLIPKLKAK